MRVFPLETSTSLRMTCSPMAKLRLPVGSSAKMISGFFTNARAIATHCFCPPERCLIEDGYVQRNPASSSRLTISKRATGRTALPLTDVEDIVRQLTNLNDTDRLFLLLPIYTGMRRSEMLGLRWTDVDFRLKQIRVQRGVTFAGNQPVIGPPKSKAGYRFIPLLPELDAALRSYNHECEYIIGGNRPITEQAYQRTWERINRTINLHGATAHVFRHTFATIAAP